MMYIKYVILATISIVADILAFVLAPVASLPFFIKTDERGRESITPMWKWITTHDAPIDIFAYGTVGRTHWLLKRWDVENPQNNPGWLKYVNRVLWIWRNPAYQLDHWMGYSQEGVELTKHTTNEDKWDTGVENSAFWTAVNSEGKKAFLFEKQSYWGVDFSKYWKLLPNCRWMLEQQYGWKLYRDDEDKICMLAIRVHPFKRY